MIEDGMMRKKESRLFRIADGKEQGQETAQKELETRMKKI